MTLGGYDCRWDRKSARQYTRFCWSSTGPPEWEHVLKYEARRSMVWVKCATSAECKSIRIAASSVMDSLYRPLFGLCRVWRNKLYNVIAKTKPDNGKVCQACSADTWTSVDVRGLNASHKMAMR